MKLFFPREGIDQYKNAQSSNLSHNPKKDRYGLNGDD
jgi:hypothetical protein